MYCLQNRWKFEGKKLVYYGLRSGKNMLKNEILLSRRQADIIASLPCELGDEEKLALKKLLDVCVVEKDRLRPIPQSIDEARFCNNCCANDFIIPGLEFDSDGLCPMCQTADDVRDLKSVVPLVDKIPNSKKSRFDVALFYTGGKDSTYLLHYLANKCGLRVLALTWEIPFMSDCARLSIENAKKHFKTVEFISRRVSDSDMKKIYSKLYEISENTCACPSLAYVLFYPELVANRVPFFIAGNEPAQILGLYYNDMAPKFAYRFADNKALQLLVNVGRIITLRPPLKRGQFHTLATMKQLAYGDSPLVKLAKYRNELVSNIVTAIHEVPEIVEPLKRSIRSSSHTGNIPAFVQIDLDEISGGKYDWKAVKDEIVRECGWVDVTDKNKGLHTSCKIEKCKEHSQFQRFYHCRSRMIPFSALEISIAGRNRNLTREEAIREINSSLGFSLNEIPECAIMRGYIDG